MTKKWLIAAGVVMLWLGAALLLSLTLVKPTAQTANKNRLESVSWDPRTNVLTWSVSAGYSDADGTYHIVGKLQNYRIDLDAATMTYQGETRGFSKHEAANVSAVLEAIGEYARDSTDWWTAGQGELAGGKKLSAQR